MQAQRSRRLQYYSSGYRQAMAESDKQAQSTGQKFFRIFFVVALYWFVSISMVFLNKYLLSSKDYQLEAPLFITLSQCMVATGVYLILGCISQAKPGATSFPPLVAELDPSVALKVLPVSVVFVGMITFNNLTLKFLGVAFYNVGRSLTTVFNVTLSYFVLGSTISCKVVCCCGVIVAGFLLGLVEEKDSVGDISVLGVICGVLASLCVALYAIGTKKILPVVDNNIWRLQFYNNLNAIPILLMLMFFMGEFPVLGAFPFWTYARFWLLLLTAGIFGIAIGYVTSLQIQVTSPLTHNVSGTAKACAQTIIACVWFSEIKPALWWLSNVMVLGGSSAYTYVRMLEMKNKTPENSEPSEKDTVESKA